MRWYVKLTYNNGDSERLPYETRQDARNMARWYRLNSTNVNSATVGEY